jgi:hypothetical protein
LRRQRGLLSSDPQFAAQAIQIVWALVAVAQIAADLGALIRAAGVQAMAGVLMRCSPWTMQHDHGTEDDDADVWVTGHGQDLRALLVST